MRFLGVPGPSTFNYQHQLLAIVLCLVYNECLEDLQMILIYLAALDVCVIGWSKKLGAMTQNTYLPSLLLTPRSPHVFTSYFSTWLKLYMPQVGNTNTL